MIFILIINKIMNLFNLITNINYFNYKYKYKYKYVNNVKYYNEL